MVASSTQVVWVELAGLSQQEAFATAKDKDCFRQLELKVSKEELLQPLSWVLFERQKEH